MECGKDVLAIVPNYFMDYFPHRQALLHRHVPWARLVGDTVCVDVVPCNYPIGCTFAQVINEVCIVCGKLLPLTCMYIRVYNLLKLPGYQ